MLLKRFRFWKTENQYSGRCPAGMAEDSHGVYCLVEDVRDDIKCAQEMRGFDQRAKAMGHVSIEALLIAAEAEYTTKQEQQPRLIPSDDVEHFLCVPEGERQVSFLVTTVTDKWIQLRVSDVLDIRVGYANYEPKENSLVWIDDDYRILITQQ
jgi:hypothetical protein